MQFEVAAKAFFEEASGAAIGVARALLEYSTLMDAFAAVQEGRLLKTQMKFDEALKNFAKASEILRATVHFGFLASYVSGCASLETASEISDDEEKFQGYKNAIGVLEQSKLALSFRDERHPLMRSIDALIKFAISRALLVESQMLMQKGATADSRKKRKQSRSVEKDFEELAGEEVHSPVSRYKIDYFLKGYEYERATLGAFIMTFPERTSLWIGNVGKNFALVETLGEAPVGKTIPPSGSITVPMLPEFHGRLRIQYTDEETHRRYDEGCLTVI